MKTFIADIIPKLQQFSKKLDNLTLLTNQHWVVVDEIANSKTVYIFRSNKELVISRNGKAERAKWEDLGNNTLLIDLSEGLYLFRQGFFDGNILALKIDGKEEYAFLINESRFDKDINSYERILEFLQRKYLDPQKKGEISSTMGIKVSATRIIENNPANNQIPIKIKTREQELIDDIPRIKANIQNLGLAPY